MVFAGCQLWVAMGSARRWVGTTRREIDCDNTMLTIVWKRCGFHPIKEMPKGERNSARDFIEKIRTPICQWLIAEVKRTSVMCHDKSWWHNAKVVSFLRSRKEPDSPHQSYSPNLAPSDFILFGDLKRKLRGCFFGLLRSFLLKYADWWAVIHLTVCWVFFPCGLPVTNMWSPGLWTTLNELRMSGICFEWFGPPRKWLHFGPDTLKLTEVMNRKVQSVNAFLQGIRFKWDP
jgi:hypothetical protein